MCDTLIAAPSATADGVALLAKNSDREPNEAHHVIALPAADHPPRSAVRCTYIEIPQAAHTYAVLLAKPFWIWGAEMGVNEHGVAIGNEAVFTKMPYDRDPGLIGMDHLRLALERAAAAREAVDVIAGLLARHGQGGNCGFHKKLVYHNSFLIADPREAWVLETAGPHWAARQVRGVYTISNGITIGSEWDLASPDLVGHAVREGWCKERDRFDFAGCYSDRIYTPLSACRRRQGRTSALLAQRQGQVGVGTMIDALRDHGGQSEWRPDRSLLGGQVCAHASWGPVRGSQTTGSIVCHLHPEHPTLFVTGASAPCTGIFKPVWLDAPLPDAGPAPTGTYDPQTLYWRHEVLHRETLRDYGRIALYRDERDKLEQAFVAEALAAAGAPAAERGALAARCAARADEAERRWQERISREPVRARRGALHTAAWRAFNRQARMPETLG